MTRLSVGDIFEIPLSNGQKAFGQYLFKNRMGPIVRVFDFIAQSDETIKLEMLDPENLRFPPVYTGLRAAIKLGVWKVIAHKPVELLVFPNFVSAIYNDKTRSYGVWYLWNGEEYKPLGRDLPEEFRSLERLVIWDPMDIVARIETGDNPYAYPRHGV